MALGNLSRIETSTSSQQVYFVQPGENVVPFRNRLGYQLNLLTDRLTFDQKFWIMTLVGALLLTLMLLASQGKL